MQNLFLNVLHKYHKIDVEYNTEDKNMTILQKYIIEKGIDVPTLSKITGISLRTLESYCTNPQKSGARNIKNAKLCVCAKIAKALDIPIERLMEDGDDEPPYKCREEKKAENTVVRITRNDMCVHKRADIVEQDYYRIFYGNDYFESLYIETMKDTENGILIDGTIDKRGQQFLISAVARNSRYYTFKEKTIKYAMTKQ